MSQWLYTDPIGNTEGPFDDFRKAEALRIKAGGFGKVHSFVPQPTVDVDAAPAEREEKAAPATGAKRDTVVRTVAEGVVSTIAVERQDRIDAHMRKFGWSPTPPLYARGSVINGTGVENFQVKRAELDAMPPTVDQCRETADLIRAENRKDFVVRVADLSLSPDGYLTRGGGKLALEADGWAHLMGKLASVFGGDTLSTSPPDLRAAYFNDMIARNKTALGERVLKLRTRVNADKQRGLFGAVGVNFPEFGAAEFLGMAADTLEGLDARGVVVYDAASTMVRVDAFWGPETSTDFSAGDVFKAGLKLGTADIGTSAYWGDGEVWRNLCLNIIIVAKETARLFKQVHRGDADALRTAIRGSLDGAVGVVGPFLSEWGLLQKVAIGDVRVYGERYDSVPKALEALVDAKKIDLGIARDVMVEALLGGYNREPGESLDALVNAVTRTAQADFLSQLQQERLERQAGQLVPVLARWAKAA